jgi:hypothetical protein
LNEKQQDLAMKWKRGVATDSPMCRHWLARHRFGVARESPLWAFWCTHSFARLCLAPHTLWGQKPLMLFSLL